MLPWFEPVLFPRSKTLQVRLTLHAIHYWREFAKLKEKKQKNMKYSWLQKTSIRGISLIKTFWKEPFLLAIISFELRVSPAVWEEIENRNLLGHLFDCCFLWLAENFRTNFSTCLSVLLPFNAKSIVLKTTSMAEYGEPGARLYTISPTLGINLQHHSLSFARGTYACWCPPIAQYSKGQWYPRLINQCSLLEPHGVGRLVETSQIF